jgi:alpha-L-glutamate ligase-like protein
VIRLVSPHTLKELGILGMNRRNIGVIGKHNPRRNYRLVDDKLLTKQAAVHNNLPVPGLYAVVTRQHDVADIENLVAAHQSFVIKPAQGSGGKGILVITGRRGDRYIKPSGAEIDARELRHHASNILAGLYSLGGRNDVAMFEALIEFDQRLAVYSYEGVPDIRIIVFQGVPVMAMMRCATHASDGKANLHQGAVGVGLDLASGRAIRAVQYGQLVDAHPDTGADFRDLVIPQWNRVLDLAASCAEMAGLGYLGADIVLDRELGPMLLELNARPGLAIQVANQAGLRHRLTVAQQIARETQDHDRKIELATERFAAAEGV